MPRNAPQVCISYSLSYRGKRNHTYPLNVKTVVWEYTEQNPHSYCGEGESTMSILCLSDNTCAFHDEWSGCLSHDGDMKIIIGKSLNDVLDRCMTEAQRKIYYDDVRARQIKDENLSDEESNDEMSNDEMSDDEGQTMNGQTTKDQMMRGQMMMDQTFNKSNKQSNKSHCDL